MFGGTEPQLVPVTKTGENGQTVVSELVQVPVIIAVVTTLQSEDLTLLGIKSVQLEEETIVNMSRLKMSWLPYVPRNLSCPVERYKTSIFYLNCAMRRANLIFLNDVDLNRFQYASTYLPPTELTTEEWSVTVTVQLDDGKGGKKEVVVDYYPGDSLEDFANDTIADWEVPESNKEAIKQATRDATRLTREQKEREAEEAKRKFEETPEAVRQAVRDMRKYKFYPTCEGVDMSRTKSKFINRYYGNATEIK